MKAFVLTTVKQDPKWRKLPKNLVKRTSSMLGKRHWQLQTAKARFGELLRVARTEGPQLINRQGKGGVIVISVEQLDRLVARSHQPKSLVQYFRESPLVGVDLGLERDKDP